MYSWHIVNPIIKDKISVLFRFENKLIQLLILIVKKIIAIVIDNDGHYDSLLCKIRNAYG